MAIRAIDQNQASYALVPHQAQKALVLPGVRIGRLAIKGNDDQLGHLLAQGKGIEPAADGRFLNRLRTPFGWRDLRAGNQPGWCQAEEGYR